MLGLYAYEEMGIKIVATIGSDYSVGYDFMQGLTDTLEAKGGQLI